MACALDLLAAVLEPPEGNTYEALVGVDETDAPLSYACFGRIPMTDATYDLYWMVTKRQRRGEGLGAKLLAALEAMLGARGARTVRIETSSLEGAGGARRFYERNGYRVVGVIPDFYRPGDDLVTLTKRLER
ncbi:MAG: GNAT family N-acetyltransferase [Myxococcales bacterium]|nr:GNAT family N-acetyltransferase [Myxococcales bacterium]